MMPQKHSIDSGTRPHQQEGVCTHPQPLSRSRLNTHTHARVQTEQLLLTGMHTNAKCSQIRIHVDEYSCKKYFAGDSSGNARCGRASQIRQYTTSILCMACAIILKGHFQTDTSLSN